MWLAQQLTLPRLGSVTALAIALTSARTAAADDMAAMVMSSGPESTGAIHAGVSLVAAEFATPLYEGTYQGVTPTVSYLHGLWSADAMLGLYRVVSNGRTLYGPGDLMLAGSLTAIDGGPWRAGVTLGAMAPVGDMAEGFGMGHVMALPATWATRQLGRVALRAEVGYARGLVALGDHDHGGGPVVAPMNLQELDWRVSASVALDRRFAVAVRVEGGVPVGVRMGVDRAIGAARLAWTAARMVTGLELQAGIMGDPFTVRGVVETAVVF